MPAVVAYDPAWPEWFATERERLQEALGDLLVTEVQHIGSTAIPGMPAKPILDLMAGVASLDDGAAAAGALAPLGYSFHPHRVDAVHYVHPDAPPSGLHLTMPGSDLWRERLAFRDAVRADPALAAEYAELKYRLLAQRGGQVYDSTDKRDFVRRVLAGAGVTLSDTNHVGR
jgi:GrpB-like predicted nucleotidyltransferase (UPF0157 family)